MNKDEWLKRYSDHISLKSGADEKHAMDCAVAHYTTLMEDGDIASQSPEEWADEEMSYWDDDGE